MKNLRTIFDKDCPQFQMDIAMESIQDGNFRNAYSHCVDMLYDEFAQLPQLRRSYRLFRYVGIPSNDKGKEAILTDISKNRITLSNPKNFNDPMDPILREWLNQQKHRLESKLERRTFKTLYNALKRIRICSLSGYKENHTTNPFKKLWSVKNQEKYLNPLMWAHYGNSHKGICIEYEISDQNVSRYNNDNEVLRLCPVKYLDHQPMDDGISIDNALTIKSNCWGYEEEARLIYFSKNMSTWIIKDWENIKHEEKGGSHKFQDYISLEGFKVKSIYFGCKTSLKDMSEITNLIKNDNPGVALFQIKFKESDISQLEASRL